MKEEIGYICPQTKKQCDDECCVSAEDCHAEAINSIISNCEPEQLNQNKMTAVEFIAQELSKQIDNNLFMEVTFNKLFEQAKEMHKKEIMDAWNDGFEENRPYVDHSEDYYNKTFKSE